MKKCSEAVKKCGFESVVQVSQLSGATVRTINRAYNSNRKQFAGILKLALAQEAGDRTRSIDKYAGVNHEQ